MTHVPYRGGGPALNDVVAGQISLVFAPPQTGLPQVKARRVRAPAVTTNERLPTEPDIPSIAETLPDFDVASGYALIGPKGLPPAVVERVNREIGRTLRAPEVPERMLADGVTPSGNTPEELRARIQREIPIWKRVAARARINID